MNIKRVTLAIAASLLVATAWAQTAPPLNLKLPANSVPAASSTAAGSVNSTVASHTTGTVKPASTSTAPGVYYGDTSGSRETDSTPATTASACDDYAYSHPQVHGSVGVGVVSGSRIGTGSYTGGDVNVTQNLGSCDHPTGSINISIGASRLGGFNGH
jgi:hypothetical protein